MSVCDELLKKDIIPSCDDPVVPGIEQQGIIINRDRSLEMFLRNSILLLVLPLRLLYLYPTHLLLVLLNWYNLGMLKINLLRYLCSNYLNLIFLNLNNC